MAETSKKIIDEVMPNPLIDLNVPTPPDTKDEIDDDTDFTITDSQLVEGNDAEADRDTEPFVDYTITDSRIADDADKNNDDINFTTTDSQLVEGDVTDVNGETEPFVDFTIADSRVVDSNDEIETMNVMMDDDIVVPNTNAISRDTGPPQQRKKNNYSTSDTSCSSSKQNKQKI